MARKIITPRTRAAASPKARAAAVTRAPITKDVVKTAKQRISEQIASRVPRTQYQLDMEAAVAARNATGAGLGDTIPLTVEDIAEQIIIEQGGVPTPERVRKLAETIADKPVNENIGAAQRALNKQQEKLARQLKKPLTPAQFDALEAESKAAAQKAAMAEDAIVDRHYPGAGRRPGMPTTLPDQVSRGDMHMAARAERAAKGEIPRVSKYASKAEQVAAINAKKAARAAAKKGAQAAGKGAAKTAAQAVGEAAASTAVKDAGVVAAEAVGKRTVQQVAKKGLARAGASLVGGPVGAVVGAGLAAWTIWDIIEALKAGGDERKAGYAASLMNAVRGDAEATDLDHADRVAEAYVNTQMQPGAGQVSPQVMAMLQNEDQGLRHLMPPRRLTFAEMMQAAGIAP